MRNPEDVTDEEVEAFGEIKRAYAMAIAEAIEETMLDTKSAHLGAITCALADNLAIVMLEISEKHGADITELFGRTTGNIMRLIMTEGEWGDEEE